jgi:hypothetical protein
MDVEEMKNALDRALAIDYTSIYKRVYESVQHDGIDHKEAHCISLKITDALWQLHLSVNSHRDGHLFGTADAIVDCTLKLLQ